MACKNSQAMLEAGDGAAHLMFVDMTQELAADSDMICGGGLSILLETVEPDGPCAAAYRELDGLLRKGVRSILSTRCEETDTWRAVNHIVLTNAEGNLARFENRGMDMLLLESFTPPVPLYIFGAGHVSLFTARVGAMIGFRTVVLDDRVDFANRDRFPEADEVIVLPSLNGCCDNLDVEEDAFVVVVTRGHLHDRNVLAEVLRTKARYVGMIGSKKKRDKIYDSLLADGFTQADIDRCHCPIGLTIGAQTPEEIAVSIAAELIMARSGATA
jgi:xanthine dehydrogenase accessory factor